jgi:hypothetical protein
MHEITKHQAEIIESLTDLSVEEQAKLLKSEWPNVLINIVSWLRSTHDQYEDKKIMSAELYYAKQLQAKGEDVNGTIWEGIVENELMAKIFFENQSEPVWVAVWCTNNIFEIRGELETIPLPTDLIFTIEQNRGIAYYVGDDRVALELADYFGKPIYKGQKMTEENRISLKQALSMDTDTIQLSVLVYPGTIFDLGNMTYIQP